MVTLLDCCTFGITFALIHVALETSAGSGFSINKCCPKGSRLLATSKLRCTTLPAAVGGNATPSVADYDWIPRPLAGVDGQDASLNPDLFKFHYGVGPKCRDSERFRSTLYFNAADYAFQLSANNGTLVEVKRFDDHVWRVGYFTDKSFCVDNVRDVEFTHAAKVCFCVEKTCILKCCGYGKYLNTEKNICLPNKKTLPNYLPVIYDTGLLPLMMPPSHVYFMPALPQCQPRGFDVLNGVDQTATSAFFVQSNGNVVLIDDRTNRTVKALNYCVDIIQTDDETVAPNLAVCQKTKDDVRKGAPPVPRSLQVRTAVSSKRGSASALCNSPLLPTFSLLTLFQSSFIK